MRYITISAVLLLCLYLLTKASVTGDNQVQKVIICGEILTPNTAEAMHFDQWVYGLFDLKITRWSAPLTNSTFRIEIPLESLGRFSFKVDDQQFLGNFAGQGALFLEPGDSIFMRITDLGGDLSRIKFSGRGAEKCYLLEDIGRVYSRHSLSPSSFGQNVDNILHLKNEIGEVIEARRCSLSDQAYHAIKAARLEATLSSFARMLLERNKSNPDSVCQRYEMMKDEFHPDQVFETKLPLMHFTRMFEDFALLNFVIRNNGSDPSQVRKDQLKMFSILSSSYDGHPVKEVLLSNYIIQHLKYSGYNDVIQQMVDKLNKVCVPGNEYCKEANNVVRNYKEKMRVSAKAFDFALQDTTGRVVSMSELRGKVVLLDFMYNGCGGCAIMAPKLEALEQKYKGRDIVFVSISVDKTLSSFKKGIGKFSSPSSMKLFTNGEGINHDIVKFYDIIAYPTIVLIGKHGNIISDRVRDLGSEQGKLELCLAIDKALDQ